MDGQLTVRGSSGGQLLALSIGGCLCNDIRYASHALEISVDEIEVDVSLSLEGDPLLATAAEVDIRVTSTASNEGIALLLDRAKQISTICNSLRRGFPVNVRQQSR